MKDKAEKYQSIFTKHYLVVLLFLSIIALTVTGVGSRRIVALIGCVLCAVALTKGAVCVDLWILVPMIVYEICSMLSSLKTYGNVFHGFFNTQLIYPVIYMLIAYLEDREQVWLQRLCVLWAGFVSYYGLFQFVHNSLEGNISRLSAVLGNPNALGCFLVIAWFAAKESEFDKGKTEMIAEIVKRIEPIILAALALTLSMGNLLALALALVILFAQKHRNNERQELVHFVMTTMAKLVLGIGPGILMYFVVVMTQAPWLCSLIILYLTCLAFYWPHLDDFLTTFKWISPLLIVGGCALAIIAVSMRSNAASTFVERFQMMKNGLGYLFRNPVLGVGPYRWRGLNKADSDMYFNTWHIHNSLIHIGVELGLIALIMAVIIIIRRYRKSEQCIAGFSAFLIHNMIDVSFFYPGITALAMLTTARPKENGYKLNCIATNILFAVFFALFVFTGFHDAF